MYAITMRTTITITEEIAELARELDINMSAAARAGIAEAIRRARARADREAYERMPEDEDDWDDAEAWT